MMFDVHSVSHVTHGVLLRHVVTHNYTVALFLEVLWEWFENALLVERYRRHYPTYRGDTPANVLGDVVAMTAGYVLAARRPVLAVVVVLLCEAFVRPNFLTLVYQWIV